MDERRSIYLHGELGIGKIKGHAYLFESSSKHHRTIDDTTHSIERICEGDAMISRRNIIIPSRE